MGDKFNDGEDNTSSESTGYVLYNISDSSGANIIGDEYALYNEIKN